MRSFPRWWPARNGSTPPALEYSPPSHTVLQQLNVDLSGQKTVCEKAGDLSGVMAYLSRCKVAHRRIGQYTIEDIFY